MQHFRYVILLILPTHLCYKIHNVPVNFPSQKYISAKPAEITIYMQKYCSKSIPATTLLQLPTIDEY